MRSLTLRSKTAFDAVVRLAQGGSSRTLGGTSAGNTPRPERPGNANRRQSHSALGGFRSICIHSLKSVSLTHCVLQTATTDALTRSHQWQPANRTEEDDTTVYGSLSMPNVYHPVLSCSASTDESGLHRYRSLRPLRPLLESSTHCSHDAYPPHDMSCHPGRQSATVMACKDWMKVVASPRSLKGCIR